MLALERKNFTLKPEVIKIFHFVHLLGKFTQVNEFKVLDSAECFLRKSEVFAQECFNTKSSPVLLCDSEASKLVSHVEVFFLQESEESRWLWNINSVHIVVIQAEDFWSLESYCVAW